MRATARLWRTDDGRLVLDGDQAAAVLAYGPGDPITAEDAKRLPGEEPEPAEKPEKAEPDEDEPEKKQAPRPAPKRRAGGRRKTGEGEGRW
ncbi:hypothetical protein ACF07Q_28615 [Nocardiopsis dassonvillei]|uniref:hypothetical protein n=1 Tax=Nocardiopsis dassonvillei TaxID=2014 RepID=UPI0036F6CBC0